MRHAPLAILAVLAVLLVGGCGSDDTADGPPLPSATSNNSPTSGESAAPGDRPLAGREFAGTTPCEGAKPPLPQIPQGTNCELATWSVRFGAAEYSLDVSYGRTAPNSTDVRDPKRVRMSGDWSEADGVVALGSADPDFAVSLLRVGPDVLHVLDADERMLIGSGGWSYSLNAKGSSASPVQAAAFDEGGTPGGGVFEGRTPCAARLKAFTADLVPNCTKLKWKLTFRQNASGEPAGYVSGVEGRDDAQRGDWEIVRGIPGHPDAVIYRLLQAGAEPLSLLLVGKNHLYMLGPDLTLLVGDGLYSYTLSRTD